MELVPPARIVVVDDQEDVLQTMAMLLRRDGRGMGVVTARIVDDRGVLVGALMVLPEDEVFAITSAGGVIRTAAAEVKQSGRQTMGVRLMNLASGDSVVDPIAIQSVPRDRQPPPPTNSEEPWQRFSSCWETVTRFLAEIWPVNRP